MIPLPTPHNRDRERSYMRCPPIRLPFSVVDLLLSRYFCQDWGNQALAKNGGSGVVLPLPGHCNLPIQCVVVARSFLTVPILSFMRSWNRSSLTLPRVCVCSKKINSNSFVLTHRNVETRSYIRALPGLKRNSARDE